MYQRLWKYVTKEQCAEYLLSFHLLGETTWPPKEQLACLYSLSNSIDNHYQVHLISKRNGGFRKLAEPDRLLKSVQKRILQNILSQLAPSAYATAYKKGSQLIDNARPHVGQPRLLKLDIEDFFESISFSMVYRQVFPTHRFPKGVGGLLTHLCCYNHCLPQGAPTSPAIANLVLKPFDEYIGHWCEAQGISYTRYCDDLTFSGAFDARQVKNKVQSFLNELGFSLNADKSSVLGAHQRQLVTGVVVNQVPQAPRRYRKQLRQEAYYCVKFGAASQLVHRSGDQGMIPDKKTVEAYLLSLLSKANFILQLNPEDREFSAVRDQLKGLLRAHRDAQEA